MPAIVDDCATAGMQVAVPFLKVADATFGSHVQDVAYDVLRVTFLGDLVVRVAGFSTRFVDLARVEQEELIARAEAL